MNWRDLRLKPLRVESEELLHLDLLRFISSVGIVFCHSIEFYWPASQRVVAHHLGAGLALFVDVFFVISGFVITYVYGDRIKTAADYGMFLQRRVGRLYPLHLLTLLIFIGLAIAIAYSSTHMVHPPSLSPRCIASNALLLHAAFPCAGFPISGVTWSLSAEFFMYLLFPLFLIVSGRRAKRTFMLAGLCFIGVLAVYGRESIWQEHLSIGRAFPAFVFGMALCFARACLTRVPAPALLMSVALIVFVLGWPTGLPEISLVVIGYLIPVFAIAADSRGRAASLVRRLAPLGQLTYPLYMLHGIFIMVLMNAIGDKLLHLSSLPMLMVGTVTYSAIIIASIASHQWFETPARRWIDRLPIFAGRSNHAIHPSASAVNGEG